MADQQNDVVMEVQNAQVHRKGWKDIPENIQEIILGDVSIRERLILQMFPCYYKKSVGLGKRRFFIDEITIRIDEFTANLEIKKNGQDDIVAYLEHNIFVRLLELITINICALLNKKKFKIGKLKLLMFENRQDRADESTIAVRFIQKLLDHLENLDFKIKVNELELEFDKIPFNICELIELFESGTLSSLTCWCDKTDFMNPYFSAIYGTDQFIQLENFEYILDTPPYEDPMWFLPKASFGIQTRTALLEEWLPRIILNLCDSIALESYTLIYFVPHTTATNTVTTYFLQRNRRVYSRTRERILRLLPESNFLFENQEEHTRYYNTVRPHMCMIVKVLQEKICIETNLKRLFL